MTSTTYSLHRYLSLCALSLAACLSALPAQAGVTISGTRQIYPAQSREITVKLTNDDQKSPRLVQVWMDDGNAKTAAAASNVPFSLTPPVFRMEAGKSQTLRIAYTREPLPADKESAFWLNVLEIPPKTDSADAGNQLRFAFRIRTKGFFRPEGLVGKPNDAAAQLRWSLVKHGKGSVLEVQNPSAYYVSFQKVALALGAGKEAKLNAVKEAEMVAPGGSQRYLLDEAVDSLPAAAEVRFSSINDYGAFVASQAPLAPATH